MNKLEEAKKNFNEYVMQYDMNEERIKRKVHHTYRVMEFTRKIANSLNLDESQTEIALFIALFHDIARFEQYTKYKTFSDLNSFDHGDYAIELLEKNKFLEKFTNNIEIQNIIKKAIKNHNKYKIDTTLNKEESMYAKIIRDADKLDIMYEMSELSYYTKDEIEKIELGTISDEVMTLFRNGQLILKSAKAEVFDGILIYMGFVFDFNYKYSIEILKKGNYISKLLAQFNFKNNETEKRLEEIKKLIFDKIEKLC